MRRLSTLLADPELRRRLSLAVRARAGAHFDAEKSRKKVVNELVGVVEASQGRHA